MKFKVTFQDYEGETWSQIMNSYDRSTLLAQLSDGGWGDIRHCWIEDMYKTPAVYDPDDLPF